MATLNTRLRDLRLEHGWTQSELAEKMAVSSSSITQYELGNRTPSMDLQFAICDIFGVSLDYLLGRTNNRGGSSFVGKNPQAVELDDYIAQVAQNVDGLMFDGVPVSDEGRESFRQALEVVAEILKKDEKQKNKG